MDEPISPRPNIHYIGVIEDVGSRVVFKKYPIDLPRALIDDLEAIRNDDEHGNLLSLQKKLISHFPEEERKFFYSDYLAPNFGYQDAYLEQTNYYPVHFPFIWTEKKYQDAELLERENAIDNYTKDVQERKEHNTPPPKESLEEFVASKLRRWRIDLRNEYYNVALGFICSHSYRAALKANQLRKRIEVKMFTTDNRGWTKYVYPINNDIVIRIDTNFGYGKETYGRKKGSSYFLLGVNYKGIEIFPYSAYVRYYYANWRTLLRHTRSYEVKRRSWDYALEFVEKYANQALADPDRFVNEFIIGEVKKMADGLAGIMALTQEQFTEQMNPENAKRPRYLGVSIPTANDIECYAVYPQEMLIAYKAEKISGALAFLGKIKTLSGTVKQVATYFDQIVALAKGILPDIRSNIAIIAEDIARLESAKVPLAKELEPLVKEVGRMEDEILAEKSKSDAANGNNKESYWDTERRRQSIRQTYIKAHPEYTTFTERCKELRSEISKIDKDIRGRSSFSKRLAACEEVAAQTDNFKDLLIQLQPHEESIATLTTESLNKCDLFKMKPAEIDSIRTSIERKYSTEHPEYCELIKQQNQTLSKIDAFVLS